MVLISQVFLKIIWNAGRKENRKGRPRYRYPSLPSGQDSWRAGNMCYSSLSPPALSTCMLSCFSHVRLCATPWTVACQAPLSMGFSRQEYWSGVPFPSLGDLPDPGINPASLMSPALPALFFTTSVTWEAQHLAQCLANVRSSINVK